MAPSQQRKGNQPPRYRTPQVTEQTRRKWHLLMPYDPFYGLTRRQYWAEVVERGKLRLSAFRCLEQRYAKDHADYRVQMNRLDEALDRNARANLDAAHAIFADMKTEQVNAMNTANWRRFVRDVKAHRTHADQFRRAAGVYLASIRRFLDARRPWPGPGEVPDLRTQGADAGARLEEIERRVIELQQLVRQDPVCSLHFSIGNRRGRQERRGRPSTPWLRNLKRRLRDKGVRLEKGDLELLLDLTRLTPYRESL